ncbi:hypothetical protein PSP6_100021 [Paraburkholderia tropica]|nr:hypothetical protein PSP6_100021 [Paraburkholderia tropica]
MQDGAPISSAGRKLERVSNGAPRGMAATRGASSDAARAQNPAYRPALPPHIDKKPARFIENRAGFFISRRPDRVTRLDRASRACLTPRRSRTSA